MNKYLIFLAAILISATMEAQSIITDRPDQTESSSTIEKGSLQIETGILIGFTEENRQETRQILAPTTLFRVGLTDGIELRVLSQYETLKNQTTNKKFSGISDLEIGAKIQLLQKENMNTEIAFLSHLILPAGSSNFTNDEYGTINKLSISHSISDAIGIGYNLGYNNFGSGDGDFTYSLALGFGLTEKVSVYIEPYGEIVEFDEHLANFDAGVTYLAKENLQLDFSFGTGFNYTMNYNFLWPKLAY